MSITNELRTLEVHDGRLYMWYDRLLSIADRIDAAHKQAVDKAHADGERNALQQHRSASEDYRRGYEAGKADGFDEGFASADDWLADHADAMAEHGWVELPKDADGVPIRIGDRVSEPEHQPNGGVVVGIKLYHGWDHWLVNCGAWVDPRKCRHVQPDTWEMIIEDALGNGGCYTNFDVERLVARCKALAGEDA